MKYMSLTTEDRNAATRVAIQQARDDLLAFVMLMNPSFSVGPHHRLLCDQLMKIAKKKKVKLKKKLNLKIKLHQNKTLV